MRAGGRKRRFVVRQRDERDAACVRVDKGGSPGVVQVVSGAGMRNAGVVQIGCYYRCG